MKKVAIYARISSENQTADRQVEELKKFAELNDFTVVDIFNENVSAYKDINERIELLRLFENVEKQKYDIILFSEFTRLARTVTELLQHIERFKKNSVELFFQKQGLWIKGKDDINTQITIGVLGVISQYEVELFAERSVSGKINAFKQRNIAWGNAFPYGYSIETKTKELVINEEEAKIVREIFKLYISGKTTLDIADYLNLRDIKAPFKKRMEQTIERRRSKGIKEKKYKKIKHEKLLWTNQAVLYILKNPVYKGVRTVTFYEPDPSNKTPKRKRNDRKLIGSFTNENKNMMIISVVDFELAQERIIKNKKVKNSEIRRENLLKSKLVCGDCGSNFSTINSNSKRVYKCYGKVSRRDKPQICKNGLEVSMEKLDGLVIQLVAKLLLEKNIKEKTRNNIKDLEKEISDLKLMLINKENDIKILKNNHKAWLFKITSLDDNNEMLKEVYDDGTQKYENNLKKLIAEKETISNSINNNAKRIISLKSFVDNNITLDINKLKNDKVLLKELIETYINEITIYNVAHLWFLVVVKFSFGGEIWGTIKSGKYKLSEYFFSPDIMDKPEMMGWCLSNLDLNFKYNHSSHKFYYDGKSELMKNIPASEYTYEEMNNILIENEWIGCFPIYNYEGEVINMDKINKKDDELTKYIDWNAHNEEVLNRLSR